MLIKIYCFASWNTPCLGSHPDPQQNPGACKTPARGAPNTVQCWWCLSLTAPPTASPSQPSPDQSLGKTGPPPRPIWWRWTPRPLWLSRTPLASASSCTLPTAPIPCSPELLWSSPCPASGIPRLRRRSSGGPGSGPRRNGGGWTLGTPVPGRRWRRKGWRFGRAGRKLWGRGLREEGPIRCHVATFLYFVLWERWSRRRKMQVDEWYFGAEFDLWLLTTVGRLGLQSCWS